MQLADLHSTLDESLAIATSCGDRCRALRCVEEEEEERRERKEERREEGGGAGVEGVEKGGRRRHRALREKGGRKRRRRSGRRREGRKEAAQERKEERREEGAPSLIFGLEAKFWQFQASWPPGRGFPVFAPLPEPASDQHPQKPSKFIGLLIIIL